MSSLSTLFGGGSGGGADPLQEGLPVIAMYGGSFNEYWEVRLHRVHSGEIVGSPWAAITNSTASYAHGQSTTQMFGYNSDYGNLTSQLSSQGYSSWNEWVQSVYQNDHYPYSAYGNCSPEGRLGFHTFHESGWYQKLYHRINVQSLKGRRPRRQFNVDNYIFSETHFNNYRSWMSSVNLSDYINTSGHVGNNNGSATYKQDTKQLIIYYADSTGSDTGYFHLIQGTVDLMDVTKVSEFFDTATYKRFRGNNVTTQAFSTIQYNIQMVLGDNNNVGVDISYDNNHYYKVFDLDVADGSTVNAYVSENIGNTTSYGPEQGLMYRGRYQQTWDSTWGCTYRPYYYYGCGLSAFLMSIANPGKFYRVNLTETSAGGILTPSGKTGFNWLTGQNTDSAGIRMWGVDFNNIQDPSDRTISEVIGTAQYDTGNQNAATYSNGNYLDNSNSPSYSFQYPGYYYSTSYPQFMTVNWWKQEGAYQK